MKARKACFIVNFILTALTGLACLTYVVLSIAFFQKFGNTANDIVLKIANDWLEFDVLREEIYDGVMLSMIAITFFMLCLTALKFMFATMQVKYFNMSFTELYTHRFRYMLMMIAHVFTIGFFIELIFMVIALTLKTRDEKELEKDLKAGSVADVQTTVFSGKKGIGGGAENLLLTPTTNQPSTNFMQQRTDEKARNNAMELWRSGAISEKQYQKIIKKLDKGRK